MIINDAYVRSLNVPLAVPYTIAYETITDVVNHFLVLHTSSGVTGIGCAAPAPEVTGETAEESLAALQAFCSTVVGSEIEKLPTIPKSCPSARTALDLAIHDIAARDGSTNIAGLFGPAEAIEAKRLTSVTVGIMSIDETISRAKQCTQEGFMFLKIKGGHDVNLDIDRLNALRDTFGVEILLALDANQGYSIRDVEILERASDSVRLEYLEQPTLKEDLDLLAQAARITSIPVMADEAVQEVKDVIAIGESNAVRLINIKLQKMGGLAEAVRIDSVAAEYGMRTMLGCMDESALSIAAALHLGATHPNVSYYDLDGHLDLTEDPFEALVELHDGCLIAKSGPGLGWSSVPESLLG